MQCVSLVANTCLRLRLESSLLVWHHLTVPDRSVSLNSGASPSHRLRGARPPVLRFTLLLFPASSPESLLALPEPAISSLQRAHGRCQLPMHPSPGSESEPWAGWKQTTAKDSGVPQQKQKRSRRGTSRVQTPPQTVSQVAAAADHNGMARQPSRLVRSGLRVPFRWRELSTCLVHHPPSTSLDSSPVALAGDRNKNRACSALWPSSLPAAIPAVALACGGSSGMVPAAWFGSGRQQQRR